MSKRVLAVDDDPRILRTFVRNLKTLNVEVDEASSRMEALEKVHRRSYHVALVDIMLTNDPHDRGGIEVIRAISALKEGTICIAISAHKTSEAPVRAYEAGVFKYVIKGEIRVPDDYLAVVTEGLDKCKLNYFGRFGDLPAYLARPQERPYWEDVVMRELGVDAGTLGNVLSRAFSPILPVLPTKEKLRLVAKDNVLSGEFWSRSRGHAVWVSIAKKGNTCPPAPSEYSGTNLIYEKSKGPENFAVWAIETPRDRYCEDTNSI